jgi:monoamine oxidase
VSVVWDADPASRGAYSYFGPGELARFGPALARPTGRVHFAGEHADPWQATMNGALASGVRAAEEVLARLVRSGLRCPTLRPGAGRRKRRSRGR